MNDIPSGLVFLPLGGSGEIGMNLNLYGYDGQWIMVDLGVSFADDSIPGVDVFMADPAFITARRDKLLGIILTHGHEDHLGAVAHLWPQLRVPVYGTAFALALLRPKLEEARLLGQVELREVPVGGRISLGPFTVDLVTVTHSLPEPNALAIRTPAGTVLHTADWKLDPGPLLGPTADLDTMRRLGDEGVLAVVGDSTNVFVPGHAGSEAAVRKSLVELIGRFTGRVAVACFASNVARLSSIAVAAAAHGRRVALAGRSLLKIDAAARSLGLLDGVASFIEDSDAESMSPNRVLYVCTGSQGEPRAALSRIATGQHAHVKLGKGDAAIFSSRIIPGNERSIYKMQNQLARLGVEVITEKDHFVHVSGHPARGEIAELYGLLRPKMVIPTHGERRHLDEHAKYALSLGIGRSIVVENGDMLRLGPGEPEVLEKVPTGRLAIDGRRLVPMASTAIKERRRLAEEGGAVVTIVLDVNGHRAAEPQVSMLGLTDGVDEVNERDRAALVKAVRDAVDTMLPMARRDDDKVREVARLAARRAVGESFGKRPMTQVHLVRL
jgi:ribonuclease J